MLFIAVALVLPGAALAMPAQALADPDRDDGAILAAPGTTAPISALDDHSVIPANAHNAGTVGAYYASYRNTQSQPVPADAPAPAPVATDGDGLSWTLAIGGGIALMLAALGLGVYAGRTVHPRHLGA